MSVLQKVFYFVLLFTGSYSFTDTPTAPPKYVLNLDLPEEQRWTNIVKDYKPLVHDLKTVIRQACLFTSLITEVRTRVFPTFGYCFLSLCIKCHH